MNKLGKITNIYDIKNKSILEVLIDCEEACMPKVGRNIYFDDGKRILVEGVKYWPERRIVDLLVNKIDININKLRNIYYDSGEFS